MKNIISPILIAILSLVCSCNKNTCDAEEPNIVATVSEIATIQNYLTANSLTATQHSKGFFYTILTEGSSTTPSLCASVTVRYKGTLLNGTVFDESTSNVSFILKNLIAGWQLGIPLVKKGGKIKLYLPPSLGYGSSSSGSIPGNSTLIFDIDLIGVEN